MANRVSRHRILKLCACCCGCFLLLFAWKTFAELRPLPVETLASNAGVRKPQVFDRNGAPLSFTYQNRWSTQTAPLHDIPPLLQRAFIESEDRRFYTHGGVDWLSRLHAAFQDIRAMKRLRGASTITEQVVRMLHPRPRTVWSRWLEGIEAGVLEKRFSKNEILEFYLNQVPYGHQRRGVVEAARFYFDRDVQTLNEKETLALAVLVRAPSSLDPIHNPKAVGKRIAGLARHLLVLNLLGTEQYRAAVAEGFEFARPRGVIEASHFLQYVSRTAAGCQESGAISSTLDGQLQQRTRAILLNRLEALNTEEVGNGAVLVVDNRTDDVLAWVSASSARGEPGDRIDAVTAPRQPGSTLKPFLYALAMEMGWTPATLIEDSPMAEPVGSGLHRFHNYSRTYYGPIRLRDALGNSLNTPAVRTIQFTGTESFLDWLHMLGISSLARSADYYGQGLALGDGEVTLFELVQAYSVLARSGEFRPLRVISAQHQPARESRPVISPNIAAIVSDILSDPQARRLEFGEGHLLRFPVRTAIKTGTSTDHRDSWAIGFTDRYTAGVWMGNLDRRPTKGITGAIGPALVLRSVFAELNREYEASPLPLAAELHTVSICSVSGRQAGPECPSMDEVFEPGKSPGEVCSLDHGRPEPGVTSPRKDKFRLIQPTQGLQIAIDPRIPQELQAFAFQIPKDIDTSRVEWIVDGQTAGETGADSHRFVWKPSRGQHVVRARIWRVDANRPIETSDITFSVR